MAFSNKYSQRWRAAQASVDNSSTPVGAGVHPGGQVHAPWEASKSLVLDRAVNKRGDDVESLLTGLAIWFAKFIAISAAIMVLGPLAVGWLSKLRTKAEVK